MKKYIIQLEVHHKQTIVLICFRLQIQRRVFTVDRSSMLPDGIFNHIDYQTSIT